MTREEAQAWLDAFVELREAADDKQASKAVAAYPTMHGSQEGKPPRKITAGDRIQWHGNLLRAAVDMWDIESNFPDQAPTLWEEIAYHDGIRIIPTTITPGLAFGLDELGWWDGKTYKSKHLACTWTPDQAPDLWEEIV